MSAALIQGILGYQAQKDAANAAAAAEAKAEEKEKKKEAKEAADRLTAERKDEIRLQQAREDEKKKEEKEERRRLEAKLEQDKKDAEALRREENALEKERINSKTTVELAKLEKAEGREIRKFDAEREDTKFEQKERLESNKRKAEAELADKSIRANRTDLLINRTFDVALNVFGKTA